MDDIISFMHEQTESNRTLKNGSTKKAKPTISNLINNI